MHTLTKTEWDKLWKPIDPDSEENRKLSLNTYARLCDSYKNSHPELTPAQWSNGRYEVYIESLLENGETIPPEIIAKTDKDANRYGDVPLLGKLLMARPWTGEEILRREG